MSRSGRFLTNTSIVEFQRFTAHIVQQLLIGKIGKLTLTRRRFLWLVAIATPGIVYADAKWFEPNWVKVRTVKLTAEKPTHRIVHITDIHHKGDRQYLESVI